MKKLFVKISLFIGVYFLTISQLNAQVNLGSTKTLLNQITNNQTTKPNYHTFTTSKNTNIGITITNYYFENGQLSMTGNVPESQNSIMIFKGTKESLYGYIVMPDENIAHEYTTDPNGNVVVNQVPVSKIIPVCDFHIIEPTNTNKTNKNSSHHHHEHQKNHLPDFNDHKTHLKKFQKRSTPILNESYIGNYQPGTDVTKLQSRPGSQKVFYLDITPVMNGDTPKHISKEEMWINWQIVAASFSMFDVNVTTDAAVYAATPVVNSGISKFVNQDGRSHAPINSFGTTQYSTMYRDRNGYDYGRTAAHEIGHQFGLYHDGGNPGGEYYEGIPNHQWVPVMGNFWFGNNWNEALYQWSKGEYSGANNQQNDFQTMSQHISFRSDDITEDTPIEFTGASNVESSINSGQIAGYNDSDVFTFTIGASGGNADLTINRLEHKGGAMLDVEATLYKENGSTIVTSNPTKARYATINQSLASGNYKLEIKGGAEGTPSNGFSNYSSMGYYGISGTITGAVNNNINNAVALSGPSTFCSNESLILQAEDNETYTYQWYKNSEPISQATTHIYEPLTDGEYYVLISNGEVSSISQNIYVTINNTPPPPTPNHENICEPGGQVEISATGSGGTINWYESATSEQVLHKGDTYSVYATENTSYFIEESSENISSVGPTNKDFGSGDFHQGDYYLVFTAEKDLTLKSVKVYASGAGNRKFVLKNSSGIELDSRTLNLPDGESRATLDFNISAGTGLKLGIEQINENEVNMYRNDSGPNYPYQIDGLVSITGSTAQGNESSYYYYCYDWEILEEGCSSEREQVEITVEECILGIEETNIEKAGIYPNPSSGIINISLAQDLKIKNVNLFSVTGKLVYKSQKGIDSINVSKLAKGVYILEIITNKTPIIKQIIIK